MDDRRALFFAIKVFEHFHIVSEYVCLMGTRKL